MYELRWRVLRERIEQMAAAAEWAHDDDALRLALCCLALLDRHRVDHKGRCRWCRVRRGWWQRAETKCVVVPVIGFHVEQQISVTVSNAVRGH